MPATDAFIGPQPLHRIPTPQSASQNVSKIADQFQYPPCVLRASQKHTYGSLSVVQLAGGSPIISSSCLYAQAKTEYNVSTKILVPRNQPSKEKSEAKNGFNFGYAFWGQFKYRQEGREAKTEAKNGFEKASPIPAATWNMKIPHNSQMASLHISCNRLPLPAPTARLQFPAKNFPQAYGT